MHVSSRAYNTVNREIFVYENIHVLNIRVNKFSRVPHENNYFNTKICQVEITAHVSPIKRLDLPLYFATETAKCKQIRAVCYLLQSKRARKKTISTELINHALHDEC